MEVVSGARRYPLFFVKMVSIPNADVHLSAGFSHLLRPSSNQAFQILGT